MKKVPYIGELLNNANIPETIRDFYYSLTPQPHDPKSVSTSYVGKINRYNNPFQYCVNGAYPLKHDWEFLQAKINDGYFDRIGISKNDIDKALEILGDSFTKGYENFEHDIVKSRTAIFSDTSDYSQIIYDSAASFFLKWIGFPETYSKGKYHLSDWDKAGRELGYFYRSWYLILENYRRFEDLFSPRLKKSEDDFLNFFIKGMHSLQKLDTKADCIRGLKESKGRKKREADFRNWFIPWFESKYDFVAAEPEKGHGRIDLKIDDTIIGPRIIEFKGWWNRDKDNIINQLTDYMTEFESSGYILIINHLKGTRNIVDNYKDFIDSKRMKCKAWEELPYLETNFKYYRSRHNFKGTKEIYHLIFNVYK